MINLRNIRFSKSNWLDGQAIERYEDNSGLAYWLRRMKPAEMKRFNISNETANGYGRVVMMVEPTLFCDGGPEHQDRVADVYYRLKKVQAFKKGHIVMCAFKETLKSSSGPVEWARIVIYGDLISALDQLKETERGRLNNEVIFQFQRAIDSTKSTKKPQKPSVTSSKFVESRYVHGS